ncbi:MAG TPA: type II secretion system protein GspC [Bdellovibrionales bacterium]|nr:type II secretion system protein GspC [Bdellovibrionales bacterium]
MGFLKNSSGIFARLPRGSKGRPPFEAFYVYILAIITGFFLADLGILYVRPSMLPTQPPPVRPQRQMPSTFVPLERYAGISDRNIFNADKKIPPQLTSDGSEGQFIDAPPVASQLPLKLEGTLVHANPKRSVATINLSSKNEVQSFMVDGDIGGMARVTSIERRKVIFRNLNNQRLEFIEIPKDSAVSFGVKEVNSVSIDDVQKKGEFDFTMRRGDIAKYTSDLGSILQQARMVPNIVPGTGGKVDGFRFVAIQPGSIYEKLGFKPMDVIKKVNNEDVNSPTKAMELYNALKSETRITLGVERNGRDETFNYNVTE